MSLPIYLQIKNIMIEEIKDLKVNDPIPSERVLAENYDASRMTVRRAIDELVDEGYLYRDAKRGTFVADQTNIRKNTLLDALAEESMDYRVLYFDVKSVTVKELQEALYIRPNEQVVRMVRLLMMDEEPYAIEEVYV